MKTGPKRGSSQQEEPQEDYEEEGYPGDRNKREMKREEEIRQKKKHTRNEIHKAMQSILSFLTFTTEVEDEYPSGYIPTLDLQVKMLEDGRITYQFYKKPIANIHCAMEKAALSEQTKYAVLAQEIIRRIFNTSELENQEVRNTILEDFDRTMEISGYSGKQRGEIMDRGLRGYEKLRRLDKEGKRPLHRTGTDTLTTRFRKKLTGKTSWYKDGQINEFDWKSPVKRRQGQQTQNRRHQQQTKKK